MTKTLMTMKINRLLLPVLLLLVSLAAHAAPTVFHGPAPAPPSTFPATGGNTASASTGTAATVQVGSVTTAAPGASARVVNVGTSSNAVLQFTIPQGYPGAQGPPGLPGLPGISPVLQLGTITTGAAGTSASASLTGTTASPLLNLTIPQGPAGPQGIPGIPGIGAGGTSSINSAKANGAKGDNVTDDTASLQGQWSGVNSNLLLDDGVYDTSAPLVPGSALTNSTILTAVSLIGTNGPNIQGYASQSGALIAQTKLSGGDSIIHVTSNARPLYSLFKNFALRGNSDGTTKSGMHFDGGNFSNVLVENVYINNVICGVITDLATPPTNGNGENVDFNHCSIAGTSMMFKNINQESYGWHFYGLYGGTSTGGTCFESGSSSGGSLSVFGFDISQTAGSTANTFYLADQPGEPTVFQSGRVEHADTVVKYVSGTGGAVGSIEIRDSQFVGMNGLAPLVVGTSTGAGQYNIVFENCTFSPTSSTSTLSMSIPSSDQSRINFVRCRFLGWANSTTGITSSGTTGQHKGIVMQDCWGENAGSTTMTAIN